MATIAFDSEDAYRAAKPPISVHPAFPAIVALWFSALLGLGSLILPAALLDNAVNATGLASVIPALDPPLTFSIRALIALVAALAGAGLGVAVARRVANSHAPKPESRISKLAGGSRRPVNVHEEIGGDGVINGESLPINRRRALAIAEDERPSDFLYVAPIPGEDPYGPALAPAFEELPADEEPLELCEAFEAEAEATSAFGGDADEEPDEDYIMAERQEFRPVSPFEPFEEPEEDFTEAEPAERDLRNSAAGSRGMEPLRFSAPSLARQAQQPVVQEGLDMEHAEPAEFEPEPVEFEAETAEFAPVPAEAEAAPIRADWESAPLENLGLVQLVQRLGSTIEKRREWAAQAAAAPAPVTAPAPLAGVQAAPAEEAAQAMAAYFGSPAVTAAPEELAPDVEQEVVSPAAPRPNFLNSFLDDEDEDEGDFPDFSMPRLRPAEPSLVAEEEQEDEEPVAEDDPADEAEDRYGSLVGLTNPFSEPSEDFVRIDEPEAEADDAPPAVVFPGQEEPEADSGQRPFDRPGAALNAAPQPTSADADAALRAALATLQRMSGAA